jgi:hypothetical protein
MNLLRASSGHPGGNGKTDQWLQLPLGALRIIKPRNWLVKPLEFLSI